MNAALIADLATPSFVIKALGKAAAMSKMWLVSDDPRLLTQIPASRRLGLARAGLLTMPLDPEATFVHLRQCLAETQGMGALVVDMSWINGHLQGVTGLETWGGVADRLAAEFGRGGDRVPALLDIGLVSRVETVGQAHHAVLKLRAFQIALAVQRGEFACCKLPDAFDDGFDQIGFGMGEAFGLGEFVDPGIDADGKQLVGGRRSKGGHVGGVLEMGKALAHLAGRGFEYSAGA